MAERTMSATEARVRLGALLDSVVRNRDVVHIERAGVPQAVMVSADHWKLLTGGGDPWTGFVEILAEHDAYMEETHRSRKAFDSAEQLSADRKERDERLGDLS